MTRYRYQVQLTCVGPVLSRALGAADLGIDAAPLRLADSRTIALPGSQVRGLLRDAWLRCARLAPEVFPPAQITAWLGPAPEDSLAAGKPDAAFRQRPAPLHFARHWCADHNGTTGRYRHRIRIDEATGAVARGALLVLESPYAPGERVCFTGHIDAELADAAEADRLRDWLLRGLRLVPAVGALRGIGYGRISAVAVDHAAQPTAAPLEIEAAADRLHLDLPWPGGDTATLRLGLRLEPLDEICFPRFGPDGSSGNRFVTGEHIPGAALKARLAAHWPRAHPLLGPLLDPLRITHGLPVARGTEQRPLMVPVSLAFRESAAAPTTLDLYDLALCAEPGLLGECAPRFAPDWKPRHLALASAFCGWPEPPVRRLRVHNRIDANTGTVAWHPPTESGLLFSVETLAPEHHHWLANLTIPDVPQAAWRPLLAHLAGCLTAPLAPLGKTKAAVRVQLHTAPFGHPRCCDWDADAAAHPADRPVVVLLQSDAALLPQRLQCPPTNGGAALGQAYRQVWRQLSDGRLELRHWYAREALAGGRYWWSGFQQRQGSYHPVLLTLAGSVFVLKPARRARPDQVQQVLCRWQRDGLPAIGAPGDPAAAGRRPDPGGASEHAHNPWIPQNGYGEVIIDPRPARERQPQAEQWHGL